MKILALNGSHDNNGDTAYLLNKILSFFRAEDTETVNIYEIISDAKTPFCVNCSSPCSQACYKGTKLEETFQKVSEADFVIIGSPVYFGSMTAQLKAFFDKTRDVRAKKLWLGKPMAAVTVGASKYGGQERTLDDIHSCALVLGMNIIGNGSGLGMGHFGVSAQKPAIDDEYANKQCESLAYAIKDKIKYE